MEVSVNDMLAARDKRVKRQAELIESYGNSLICFTMNIAGPVKTTPLIEKGFLIGVNDIFAQLNGENIKVLHFEKQAVFTGCTAFFSVEEEPRTLKKLMAQIEDSSLLGRLFDIDVLDSCGKKISRTDIMLPPRKCLLCENEAVVCSSSRAHSVEELQNRTSAILSSAYKDVIAKKAASAAVRALFCEVLTTPKPGLVDRDNSGSHADMDIFTFAGGISVLYPYFKECAACGFETAGESADITFKMLRYKGKLAQADMLRATGGINTHKGAVFSLGITAAACARLAQSDPDEKDIMRECARMTCGISKELEKRSGTAGEAVYRQYGIKGVRGQAENGFPAVTEIGYPTLLKGLSEGHTLNDSAVGALLAMLSFSGDTNMLKRTGSEKTEELLKKAETIIKNTPFPDGDTVKELDRLFIKENASPGGSADLLSLCLFLYFYKSENNNDLKENL